MTTQRLIKAIEKSPTLTGVKHDGRLHTYYNSKYVLEIIDQDGWACNVYLRNKNQHDDTQSDYFAGTFYHSIKSVVESFNNLN